MRIVRHIRCVQQKKLVCNCYKIRELDWCTLLILAKSRRIYQLDSRILKHREATLSAERNHSLHRRTRDQFKSLRQRLL